MIFPLINQLVFFLIFSIGLLLAFWVYFAEKKQKTNQYFFWMVLTWIVGEVTPYFIFRNIFLPQSSLFFLPRIEIASVFVFFIFFYFFSIYFLKEEKKFPVLNKLVPFIAIVGACLAIFTNLFQKSVEVTPEGLGLDLILTTGGKISWLGFVIVMTLFIFSRFLINYSRATKKDKLKLQYFLAGISFWITINLVFNVYFPLARNTFLYAYLGNYSIIILFAFTAYAVVKQELFGIRVVLTTLFVGLIAILLLLDAMVFTENSMFQILKGIVLLVFLYFGYSLIKSVLQEIKRREEVEQMSWKLQKAYQELKKLDVAKSEFIAMASHQLRTPLSIVKGYVSMLMEGSYGKAPERFKKPLKNIFNSNERLVKIINDLLDISKIELGKSEVSKEKIQLESLIDSVVKELMPEAENKGISLKWEKPEKPLQKIEVDPLKINQVIECVVDNAIKYTKKGGVVVKTEKLKSKIRIIISDTGAGMSKQEKQMIFESFTRGTAGINLWVQGVGLGLYLAKKYVELHKGKIWAESAGKGKGSVFYIELPVK